MKKYFNYLSYVVRHIWYVRKACWKLSSKLMTNNCVTLVGDMKFYTYQNWFLRKLLCGYEKFDIRKVIGTKNVTLATKTKWWQMLWLGLIHDLSRFRPSEFIPYSRSHGAGKVKRDPKTGYYSGTALSDDPIEIARERAMMWHWYRNPHHWEHWAVVLPTTHIYYELLYDIDGLPLQHTQKETLNVKFVDIPEKYLLEMACDWWGASMAQGMGGRIWQRYIDTKGNSVHMSQSNREFFESALKLVEELMNGKIYVK